MNTTDDSPYAKIDPICPSIAEKSRVRTEVIVASVLLSLLALTLLVVPATICVRRKLRAGNKPLDDRANLVDTEETNDDIEGNLEDDGAPLFSTGVLSAVARSLENYTGRVRGSNPPPQASSEHADLF